MKNNKEVYKEASKEEIKELENLQKELSEETKTKKEKVTEKRKGGPCV